MRIICFAHFCCRSEVSRLVEIGKALREVDADAVLPIRSAAGIAQRSVDP